MNLHPMTGDIDAVREALTDRTIASYPDFVAAVGTILDELERLRATATGADLTLTKPANVGEIVPDYCTGYSFVFDPGVLHVKKDGSGYVAIDEKDFVLEDDRDGEGGSVHWISRIGASEMVALRDFLNGATTPRERLVDCPKCGRKRTDP